MTDPCCGLSVIFLRFHLASDDCKTINTPEIFSGVHNFTGKTAIHFLHILCKIVFGVVSQDTTYIFFFQKMEKGFCNILKIILPGTRFLSMENQNSSSSYQILS